MDVSSFVNKYDFKEWLKNVLQNSFRQIWKKLDFFSKKNISIQKLLKIDNINEALELCLEELNSLILNENNERNVVIMVDNFDLPYLYLKYFLEDS